MKSLTRDIDEVLMFLMTFEANADERAKMIFELRQKLKRKYKGKLK